MIIRKAASNKAADTEHIGAELARTLGGGDFVALYGDLGVGKTAFVRGIASVLAPEAYVQSPTYTVVNSYRGASGIVLHHFDMYRIKDEDDLYSVGFFDYDGRDAIIAVEWSENIPFALPSVYYKVTIERSPGSEDSRTVTIERID